MLHAITVYTCATPWKVNYYCNVCSTSQSHCNTCLPKLIYPPKTMMCGDVYDMKMAYVLGEGSHTMVYGLQIIVLLTLLMY
ncbi:hypothetical protein GDO81_012277 [Engystomops pustulosus]|uniref:Uncharacterized protein n=1 Tax=Engystomops pustulosus TaxID=76066 RepID=A0AAV7BKP1_ENGPU|nr:hypothetical protein GDO81_012277 [Engystomops pustulosus]